MSESTEAKIRRIMKENMELTTDVDEIKLDDVLTNYGINSIAFVKLIVLLENEFNFEIEDENLEYTKLSTLSSLLSYIETRLYE
ncbi:phosphopantetheine-binding protein [Paenibacillus pinihumi]|uniref:phosphopantetheine-binding protein n=1 Tax=Paenibacillus pinihumi TaxID=669462 RepID=UPI00048F1B66|nr:phosphopantetheine-binding protein [Paenibacillus pinihumi]